jgi:hypothetical protein
MKTTFTWVNNSIGRDKAGVPLSKTTYGAFCDCKVTVSFGNPSIKVQKF